MLFKTKQYLSNWSNKMSEFTFHTPESAPEKSKAILEGANKRFGTIPNLYAVLAESPETLNAYMQLNDYFTSTSFDAEELTVVWQTINVEHECGYCVPGHSLIAQLMKVDPAINEALRNQQPMPTAKLQALHEFTIAMVRERGNVSKEQLASFFAAGYGQKQVLEVILGLSQKVISNYVNHVAETPVDAMAAHLAWAK